MRKIIKNLIKKKIFVKKYLHILLKNTKKSIVLPNKIAFCCVLWSETIHVNGTIGSGCKKIGHYLPWLMDQIAEFPRIRGTWELNGEKLIFLLME